MVSRKIRYALDCHPGTRMVRRDFIARGGRTVWICSKCGFASSFSYDNPLRA